MCSQLFLGLYQPLDLRAELFEKLVVAFRYRTGDNQRSTGIVNQYGVHLIDDGVVVLALHEVFRADGHVVTQVVETEFIVRTESDICQISLATGVGVRLMPVDAIHAQSVEHIKRTHPLGVTFGQIVIDCHHMHAVSGQGIEEYRQGGYQRLTFTCRHFGDFTFMQYHTAEQLYVIMYHIPYGIVSSCHPMVLVDGFVTFNAYEIFGCGKMAVKFGSCNHHFLIFGKTFGGFLHNGESDGQHFIKGLFINLQYFFFDLVNLVEELFTLFQLCIFNAGFQFFHFGALFVGRVMDISFQFFSLGAQGVIVEFGNFGVSSFDFLHPRLYFFHVACGFVAENRA